MRLARILEDETGLVLSAETVMIGTLGVLGAVVGVNAAATAVDQELKEFASAIRSLDQSYGYVGHQSCGAWTAGSYYRQAPVQQSLSDLCNEGAADIRAIEKRVDAQRALLRPENDRKAQDSTPAATPAPITVIPNDIKIQPGSGNTDTKSKSE